MTSRLLRTKGKLKEKFVDVCSTRADRDWCGNSGTVARGAVTRGVLLVPPVDVGQVNQPTVSCATECRDHASVCDDVDRVCREMLVR